MNWNWLGWVAWLGTLVWIWYVIHYIRVHQLMLIAREQRRLSKRLMAQYVGLGVIAVVMVSAMSYVTWFRNVAATDTGAVVVTTKYRPLQIASSGDNYYYVKVNHSAGGNRGVVSYTYQTQGNQWTTSAYFTTLADGNEILPARAMDLPWQKAKLTQMDKETGHAFVATMDVKYRDTWLNGLGLRSHRTAAQYTLLRIPSDQMEIQK